MTAKSFSITLGRPLGATLLLGGLVVAALFAVGAVWADLSTATEERDAKADLLERGVAASQRARLASPAAPRRDPFVPAESATLAAARIDSDLRALAQASGVALLSSRADAKPEEPGAGAAIGTRIETQATVEGQNDALQELLLKLETGDPTVLIDDLTMEPVVVDQAAPGDPQAPRLRVSLTLTAYWRPARASNPAP